MSEPTPMLVTHVGDLDALLRTGAALSNPRLPLDGSDGPLVIEGGTPYVVLPEGYKVADLEALLPVPARKRGAWKFRDAASLIAYFKQHSLGHAKLYGRIDPPRFVAIFNDHQTIEPGWRDHTATYECPLSPEWKVWLAKNKAAFKQAEFAQFIEDNLPDIVEPAGADMLLISRTLEAKKKVNFASGVRLDNGQVELTYEEDIQGTAGKGKLQIPETFAIGIPVLEGGQPYKLTARLRYRIDAGNLVIWYDLLRPHKVIEDAIRTVWQHLETETFAPILNGDPDLSA